MYSQPHSANGPTMTRTLCRAPILGLPTTMMRIEPVRAPQERLPMLGRRSSAQKKPQQHEHKSACSCVMTWPARATPLSLALGIDRFSPRECSPLSLGIARRVAASRRLRQGRD